MAGHPLGSLASMNPAQGCDGRELPCLKVNTWAQSVLWTIQSKV